MGFRGSSMHRICFAAIYTSQRIPLRPDPGVLRQRGATTLVRAAAACLIAETSRRFPNTEVASIWPDDRDLHLLVKSVVSPASTSTPGWASTLCGVSRNRVARARRQHFEPLGRASKMKLLGRCNEKAKLVQFPSPALLPSDDIKYLYNHMVVAGA